MFIAIATGLDQERCKKYQRKNIKDSQKNIILLLC
jgi:hypothetical protein